ncbi:MAG TPA: BatD family protein, partial [Polyangiaceae bacterium]
MRLRCHQVAALVVAFLVLVLASVARAQVAIQSGVSARRVEIGQSIQFQIIALDSSGQVTPSDPELPPIPGVEVRGPSVGTQTQVSINNGRMTQSVGISATWSLTPRRAGTIRIGPASVAVGGGRRAQSRAETIEVVPPGSLPRNVPRRFDPFSFDPFGMSPFPANPFATPDAPEEPPPVPEEYRVERAPDPVAFLRAVVTPKKPVVGEQVTLRVYAYGGRGRFADANASEPSRADFLAYTTPDAGVGEQAVRVRIGEQDFIALKIMEIALFPLHSGECVIGSMTMTFNGPGYRSQAPVVRKSEPLVLDVGEPPLRGRPPGYKLGDVGEFELSARVDPLRIVAGDAVSVVAKLSGTGNVPASLVVPQQRGVDWLKPSVTEDIDVKGGTVKGLRVFSYVVKLEEPGRVDLGELTLPYFDPKRGTYAVARAALGKVEVAPNPAHAAAPGASTGSPGSIKTGAAALPAARKALGAFALPPAPFTDGLGFWALLLAAPLAVALTGAGLELGKRAAERMRSRRTDPDRLALEALREADEAARAGRSRETAGAVERALFRAIEAGTGLKARAFLRAELDAALGAAGIEKSTVSEALALLDACETLRFTDGADQTAPRALA